MDFDPKRVVLFTELFQSVAEEMGSVLERSAYSTNIKERRDYSCAVFDKNGNLLAQAAHIPVHLGAMEFLMKRWIQEGPAFMPNQLYITNDPFFAGTHLPDITVVRPIALNAEWIGYAVARAHHADIGGQAPGSFAPVSDIREEGILIHPQPLTNELIQMIAQSSRNPDERWGDLECQAASTMIGATRFLELAQKFSNEMEKRMQECYAYSEAMTRQALSQIPVGTYYAEDWLEDVPEVQKNAFIRLTLHVPGDNSIAFDFTGTDAQQPMGVNATEAVTRSACSYVVRCLSGDIPTNTGCFRPITLKVPRASLVNAEFPAPVVAGNTETSQRITDVILQALAKACPDRIPACSQGTMNNIAIGAKDWAYYETIAGGAGGGPNKVGADAIHTHMTNTRNTPIESLEIELPIRIRRYGIREGSGGHGIHPGGNGVIREYEILADSAELSLMTDRRKKGPPGLGGDPGLPGRNLLIRDGETILLPSKGTYQLKRGDVIRIETPGGGGWSP